jgi:hypothetical protein
MVMCSFYQGKISVGLDKQVERDHKLFESRVDEVLEVHGSIPRG